MNAAAVPAARLLELIAAFEGRRVAVVGDFVCDEFLHGDIARISREAPVLILEETKIETVPGGAGNAVVNLRALGADPLPVGIVGRDPSGERLLKSLREADVDLAGMRAEGSYGTPTKSRVLAGGVHTRRQQIVRIDRGSRHGSLPRPVLARIAARLARALRKAAGLLVADYGYGAAAPPLVRAARAALPADFPVTVDSRSRVGAFKRAWACTPNQEEAEAASGITIRSERDVDRAGRALLAKTGNRAALVTRGARGMSLIERRAATLHVPAFGEGEVADVTGAGDTVIAVFTLALISGASWREAALLSNYAAGLVVMKYGTATVTRGELAAAVRSDRSR
jgi:rfaE bifunctional protein kinase chain/domain